MRRRTRDHGTGSTNTEGRWMLSEMLVPHWNINGFLERTNINFVTKDRSCGLANISGHDDIQRPSIHTTPKYSYPSNPLARESISLEIQFLFGM